MASTTYDELYTTLCELVTKVTGRPCWRRAGIQAQPNRTYASVYLTQGVGMVQDVVEELEIAEQPATGETLSEVAWGVTHLKAEVDFLRSATDDSANDAATRFRNSLQMSARYDDLWQIAGLTGGIEVMDISAIFRADTEERVKVLFGLYANISNPDQIADTSIYEIESQNIDLQVVMIDGTTEIV